jgi:hypothetical protein
MFCHVLGGDNRKQMQAVPAMMSTNTLLAVERE